MSKVYVQMPETKIEATGSAFLALLSVCQHTRAPLCLRYTPSTRKTYIDIGFIRVRDIDYLKAIAQAIRELLKAKGLSGEDIGEAINEILKTNA